MTEFVYEGYLNGDLCGATYTLQEWDYVEFKGVKIVRVDNRDGKWHSCPYSEEICGDYNTLCSCSEEQQLECRMDI